MPCTARYCKGDTPKHQAPGPGPQAPSPKAATCSPPEGRGTLGLGRVVRRRVACGLCISPSHTYGADKFNIGFHAPPSRRSQPPSPPHPRRPFHPPKFNPNATSQYRRILPNPALSSYVLCVRSKETSSCQQRQQPQQATDNVLTNLVSPFGPVPPSPSPTVSQGTRQTFASPRSHPPFPQSTLRPALYTACIRRWALPALLALLGQQLDPV